MRVVWRRCLGLAAAAGIVFGMASCSEELNPLDWDDANRGGLGDSPDTLVADTLCVAETVYPEVRATGTSSYFSIGSVTREEEAITAQTYLRWDLTDLPEGDITEAAIDVHLRDIEAADSTSLDPYRFEMRAVTASWEEGDLGLGEEPAPADTLLMRGRALTLAGYSGDTDSLLTSVFGGDTLLAHVQAWQADSSSNLGVVLLPGSSPDSLLRFISSEGTPEGYTTEISTPALVLEMTTTSGDTSITLEPIADGWIISAQGEDGVITVADSLLLMSSGFVQRILLRLDVDDLLASDPARFPEGIMVHAATLSLRLDPDQVWSLAPENERTIQAMTTTSEWSEGEIPEEIEADTDWISYATIAGDDTAAVLDIRHVVQQLVEGEDLSLLIRSTSEVDVFRTIVFRGRQALVGRPQIRMVFSRPSPGRLEGES